MQPGTAPSTNDARLDHTCSTLNTIEQALDAHFQLHEARIRVEAWRPLPNRNVQGCHEHWAEFLARMDRPVDVEQSAQEIGTNVEREHPHEALARLKTRYWPSLMRVLAECDKHGDVDDDEECPWTRCMDRASALITALCGRGSSGPLTRSWTIVTSETNMSGSRSSKPLHFDLREPPFVEADLGWKTWGGGVLMAKLFAMDDLLPVDIPLTPQTRLLELGSGTGILALTILSKLTGNKQQRNPSLPHYDMTDFNESVLANLSYNVDTWAKQNGVRNIDNALTIRCLDWFKYLPRLCGDTVDAGLCMTTVEQYDLILAADVIYNVDHAESIPAVVDALLACNGVDDDEDASDHVNAAEFICILPLRPQYHDVVAVFEKAMGKHQFTCIASIELYDREVHVRAGEDVAVYDENDDDEMCRDGVWYRWYRWRRAMAERVNVVLTESVALR